MVIAIGYDHVGYEMKDAIKAHLEQRGHTVRDLGPDSPASCSYAVYGRIVGRDVREGNSQLGVLICGTGIGISLAANKVRGIRAAVCSEPYSASMARRHNNAQIIAFGARVVGVELAKCIVDAFLDASPEGGRHADRVAQIMAIEDED